MAADDAGDDELQTVEPAISRAKFDREITHFRSLEDDYRRRGWFLVEAAYPTVFVVMAAPQLTPSPVVTGVQFDYTNYDARPPSVRLVNPFTREPYRPENLPVPLVRRVEPPGNGQPPDAGIPVLQTLMQAHDDEVPFLCLAGVREYHDHPGHSGDPWELHRCEGAGSLVRLLSVIHTYGPGLIAAFQLQLNVAISGFQYREPPL